jgi:hypothetical protein
VKPENVLTKTDGPLAKPEEAPGVGRTPQVLKAKIVDGALTLEVHEDRKGKRDDFAAFGSDSNAFQAYAFTQLLNLLKVGQPESDDMTSDVNKMLAMLSAIAPQNEMEAMLAAQMVATHHLAMRQLAKHAYSDALLLHETHANLGIKLMRTFSAQVDTLARLRRGGEQVVRHVHVNSGGQAVVAGTINHGTGEG